MNKPPYYNNPLIFRKLLMYNVCFTLGIKEAIILMRVSQFEKKLDYFN